MNIRFLIFLLLISFGKNSAQTTISGTLFDETNTPLEGASVYFNNTTVGTITDEKGAFQLKIKEGNYTLVASFLGYEVQQIPIVISSEPKLLNIQMKEANNVLDEVDVSKTVYDDEWRYNLARFKRAFLGRTKLASDCKILNEKDLRFEYDFKTNTLNAFARKPLEIKHTGLGYLISYDLVDFTMTKNQFFYSGYARYQNLRTSVRKKWKRNRLEAYHGSKMHFFRSLINKKIQEEGFVVNQFKRVLNPERPSEEKINQARQLVRLHRRAINFSKKITTPKTPLDSAIVTLRKSRLPKHKDYLYKKNVPYEEMISFENDIPILNFDNYLMIIYTKEPEEKNYLMGIFGKMKKATGVQTSHIVLLHGKSALDKAGVTTTANAIFNEGYWGFESFANMLPLDYSPNNEE